MSEKWKVVWREGFAPQLTRPELIALEVLLASDSIDLQPNFTSWPPLTRGTADEPVEWGCPLTMARKASGAVTTVKDAERSLNALTVEADRRCAHVDFHASRHFLEFVDGTPREVMVPALLAEVRASLRATEPPAPSTGEGE